MAETKKARNHQMMTMLEGNGLNYHQALDIINSNIFCAGTDFCINYVNKRAMDVMHTIAGEVKDSFGVDVNNLVGTCIDKFHKGRAKDIRKLLNDPKNFPILTEISFGGLILSLNISRLLSNTGAPEGYIVNWDEISDKKATENSMLRSQNMVANTPVNIMTAGLDFKLNYLNPKSIETLKTIEQYLPKPVEELEGESIDIFHKNPSFQRKILSDPKNLPHKAIIKVGPELLDLLITALYDKDGKYIGPMLTWEVVTEKVKNENEMARFTSMIKNAPVNILLSDLDFTLTYMNPKSAETLKTIEQYLPKPVEELEGESIDIFHKNPSFQRKILSDPKNLPHKAIIKVGPELLDLLITALYDKDGKYVGPMLTWEVVTEKVKNENEMARFTSMIKNAPVNILLSDLDFTLTYMNPKSEETLKTIEQYLPKPVDQLQGESIDIFHKNPSFQRKILSDPKNLPHKAIIKVGPELLDLLITALYDKDGKYVGPMLTWDVVTEKKKNEGEMARFTNMIKNAPVNILLSDLDFTLTYMNPKSEETLKSIEQYLPKPVDQLTGESIDIFHKNPSFQRKILSNPKNLPHSAIIKVGPELLDLLITALYDNDGKYMGPMLTWEVVTEKKKSETEMARFNNMIESSPINILLADLDFNLTYINPKSVETLKTVQQYLPKPVDQLLGSSIDIFHKNPSYQRKIVGDPKNLPHKAKIRLGPETLDLLISPIFDNNNKYLGPMLTWEVITQKTGLVETLGNTSNDLASSSEELLSVSQDMTKSAQQTTEQATAASASSEEVSTGVQTVATSMEEMSASIKEITKSTNESSSMSNEAAEVAQSANEIINQLGASSQDIGNVIKVISSIAQQTNLLALNATIEAARAGEAGKGFAVVANEVKELAKETAIATADITKKIEAIQGDSKGAVEAVEKIGKLIEKLNTIAGTIASAVEEQAATTADVSRVVQESTVSVKGIASNVSEVNKAAKLTTEGCSQTQDAANTLNKLATSLKDLVKEIDI